LRLVIRHLEDGHGRDRNMLVNNNNNNNVIEHIYKRVFVGLSCNNNNNNNNNNGD